MNNPPTSINTASRTAEEIKQRIITFRMPMFGESEYQKQEIINKTYPNMFPGKPVLDIGLSNHMLNSGNVNESMWQPLVRYSLQLPSFYPRVVQPRVMKCYDASTGERYYIIKKYISTPLQCAYYYFDPLYFTAPIPIYIEHEDILTKEKRQRNIMNQLKYCLNTVQAKSLLSMSSIMPTINYDLTHLQYNLFYKRGFITHCSNTENTSHTSSPSTLPTVTGIPTNTTLSNFI